MQQSTQKTIPRTERRTNTCGCKISLSSPLSATNSSDRWWLCRCRWKPFRVLSIPSMNANRNMGGFDGAFTESGRLSVLRVALLEAAHATLGKDVTDILITDVVRQEM